MKLAVSILLALAAVVPCFSQETVQIDWRTKTLGTHPAVVDHDTPVTIRIEYVNDILFTYSISVQGQPRENYDFSAIEKAFALAGKSAAETPSCQTNSGLTIDDFYKKDIKALTDALNNFFKLPETIDKGCSLASPCSVSLAQAQDSWKKTIESKLKTDTDNYAELSQLPICKNSFAAALKDIKNTLDDANSTQARLYNESSHVATQPALLKPDYDYTLTVAELYHGVATKSGTYNVELKPANNRLTLSAGVLISQIQNRSYSSRSVPLNTGSGTQNVLSVDGMSGFSPDAIALLNYQIPHLDSDNLGLALSTGPVLRLGSKSDTSSFGYFAGISAHLFHRFYVTPGFHLGEFADFPAGFTHAGQVVPAGSQTLIPVKRWTWRFAIGITYKAKDFSSFGLGGNVTKTTPQAPAQSAPSKPTDKQGKN